MSKELDYIADLERENRLLGERCNQLLKDKGNLTDELQELKETLAQTVENNEVAYETLKLHDQEEIGMLNSKVTELENKIADIKANCDLAIEGREVKIKELELELTVEKDLHQEETNLHLHAEDYIKSLEQQIEKMKRCEICKHYLWNHCSYEINISEDCIQNKLKHFELKEIKENEL